jgi:hypothetical protein
MGLRGPRPGPRLRATPVPFEPSGQLGLTRAPVHHTLLTEIPDSDKALPQATFQSRPRHQLPTQAPVQLIALTVAPDSDDLP